MRPLSVLGSVALLCVLTSAAYPQKTKKPRHDPRVITTEEIQARTTAMTALDLVAELRPSWLSSRGHTSIMMGEPGIAVYVDGVKRGSVDELRFVTREQIEEIRFLTPTDAATRYGLDHPSGAIEITTTKRGNG